LQYSSMHTVLVEETVLVLFAACFLIFT